jgi:hypothetical protein
VSFFVVAVCSATFASKPCHALNGGYTVQVTLDGTPVVYEYKGVGRQQIAFYIAKLYDGTHEVPALQECGKQISWDWQTIYVTHLDERGNQVIDPNSTMVLQKNQNKAQVTLPTASSAHYGYTWDTSFVASASQGTTDCHPQGWE